MGVEYYLCVNNGRDMVVVAIGRGFSGEYKDVNFVDEVDRILEEIEFIVESDDIIELEKEEVNKIKVGQISKLHRIVELIKRLMYDVDVHCCGGLDRILSVYGFLKVMEVTWMCEVDWAIVSEYLLDEYIEDAKREGINVIRLESFIGD